MPPPYLLSAYGLLPTAYYTTAAMLAQPQSHHGYLVTTPTCDMHMPYAMSMSMCMQVMLAQPSTTKWLIHGYETCGFAKVEPLACHAPPTDY